jgi:light-harvesting complex 1 beta chain
MAHEYAVRPMLAGESPLKGLHAVFIMTFFVFLLLALVSQIFTWNWRAWLPGAEGTSSLWDGVQAATYTVISQII